MITIAVARPIVVSASATTVVTAPQPRPPATPPPQRILNHYPNRQLCAWDAFVEADRAYQIAIITATKARTLCVQVDKYVIDCRIARADARERAKVKGKGQGKVKGKGTGKEGEVRKILVVRASDRADR